MKRNTYSLATVFLLVAIVAIAAASLRGLWSRLADGPGEELLVPAIFCAFAGCFFGVALAIWTRTGSIWDTRNLVRLVTTPIFGLLLGAAAGAQAMAKVSWAALLLTPPIVVGFAALVVLNRRRRRRSELQRARRRSRSTTHGEPQVVVHPLDRPDPQPAAHDADAE